MENINLSVYSICHFGSEVDCVTCCFGKIGRYKQGFHACNREKTLPISCYTAVAWLPGILSRCHGLSGLQVLYHECKRRFVRSLILLLPDCLQTCPSLLLIFLKESLIDLR